MHWDSNMNTQDQIETSTFGSSGPTSGQMSHPNTSGILGEMMDQTTTSPSATPPTSPTAMTTVVAYPLSKPQISDWDMIQIQLCTILNTASRKYFRLF